MTTGRLMLLHLCLLFFASTVWAVDNDPDTNIYTMPVAETEEVAVQWLEDNGFEVYRLESSYLRAQIQAEKKDAQLTLTFQPQSPLATSVRIKSASKNSEGFAQALKRHLSGYIHLPAKQPAQPVDSIPDSVRGMQNIVVCIYTESKERDIQFSGFVIDTRGFIVCTAHDLNPDQHVSVVLYDGREIKGQVVRIDPQRDLSIIRVNQPLENAVTLRNGRYLLRHGDTLFAVTCPMNRMNGIQSGFLDGPPRRVLGLPLWQVQMHVDPGSSGSPVFDAQGRLSAIVKGRFRGTDSVGFLIPFETLLNFLDKY